MGIAPIATYFEAAGGEKKLKVSVVCEPVVIVFLYRYVVRYVVLNTRKTSFEKVIRSIDTP